MAATRWQVIHRSNLRCRSWEDEYVVYNPVTGDTHLLSALGGLVLRTLCASEAPLSLEELTSQLLSSCEASLHELDPEFLQAVLEDFRRICLLEEVPS